MPWSSHLTMQDVYDFTDRVGNDEHSQTNRSPLWNVRDRLFFSLFERISSGYSSAVPPDCRKSLEYILLAFAFLPLFILIYIHINFVQTPVNCLADVSNHWPRDGILRVELGFKDLETHSGNSLWMCHQNMSPGGNLISEIASTVSNETNDVQGIHDSNADLSIFVSQESFHYQKNISANSYVTESSSSVLSSTSMNVDFSAASAWPQQLYIIEYTLEYGFLKLSDATRQKLKIPVLVVVLDPYDEKCFGNTFSQFLLRYVVGYSDVLMSSLKNLVDKDETKGFVRNVVSGDQYRFVNKTLTWTSYVVAGLTMIAFTLSISMLLRYSHYQIFLFIVQLLHVLEFNLNASFPAASILTVVFALVGMEAIMSEFFNDSTTALYVILIVWCADQYDSVCCRHVVTKRHWLRFFYLYHFAFYAYDYRFNGQYSLLALLTSWMFIQHSMIYFFHRFELVSFGPQIESSATDSSVQSRPNHSSPSSSNETFTGVETSFLVENSNHVSSESEDTAMNPQLPANDVEVPTNNENSTPPRNSSIPVEARQKYSMDKESNGSTRSSQRSLVVETLELGARPQFEQGSVTV